MGTSNNTIKRNKKVMAALLKQKNRLKIELSIRELLETYIFPYLVAADIIDAINAHNEEEIKDILNKENILIETVKFIGIMETCFNTDEFLQLMANRQEIVNKKPELNDFDIVLQNIMKVPKPKD